MADFMRVKYENPKMKQSEIANQLSYSTSTLQRYGDEINMLSPYRIGPNNTNEQRKKTSNTNSNNDSFRDPDHKRPQSTSNENSKKVKTQSNLKAPSMQQNIEIIEHYLDEILLNNNS